MYHTPLGMCANVLLGDVSVAQSPFLPLSPDIVDIVVRGLRGPNNQVISAGEGFSPVRARRLPDSDDSA